MFNILPSKQFGHTALFFASLNGHVDVVKKLLECLADVSLCDAVKLYTSYSMHLQMLAV